MAKHILLTISLALVSGHTFCMDSNPLQLSLQHRLGFKNYDGEILTLKKDGTQFASKAISDNISSDLSLVNIQTGKSFSVPNIESYVGVAQYGNSDTNIFVSYLHYTDSSLSAVDITTLKKTFASTIPNIITCLACNPKENATIAAVSSKLDKYSSNSKKDSLDLMRNTI